MQDNEEIIKDFEKKFKEFKDKAGFTAKLEKLNEFFRINDFIIREGFASKWISRQISNAISEVFSGYLSYLHGIIMPNTQNMLNLAESKLFPQEEKKEIYTLMSKIIGLLSKNHLNSIELNEKNDGEYLDLCIEFFEKELKEKMKEILKKASHYWMEGK